jgi:GntR family transcriptional regulator / MocR family aminotransferase
LRMGYVVLPEALMDRFIRVRSGMDLYPSGPNQAILCDFIVEGHLGRHIRRMRELYASRLAALRAGAQRYLGGLLEISPIRAGLSTPGFLQNGLTSRAAEWAAAERGIEVLGLNRFALERKGLEGVLLGFAAFDEHQIGQAVMTLAAALEKRNRMR